MGMGLLEEVKSGSVGTVPENAYDKYIKQFYDATYDPKLDGVQFDPVKHLRYYAEGELAQHKFNNTRRLTMAELDLTNERQISNIGVSDPFPLFTDEAVQIMKSEVLAKKLFEEHARVSHLSASGKDINIRGYAKTDAPFTYQAWTHPKTAELVSTMAGVELEVVMDYEVAHTNVTIKDEEEVKATLEAEKGKPRDPEKDCVVGWHYDSYPFVCVLMLSDTTNMIGGETVLRMGKGNDNAVAFVPGPTRGYGTVLQGRFIEHIGSNPLGATERITMVTSYRAKDPKKPDGSVLSTVKPEMNFGSRYDTFYPDWVKYRSDLVINNLKSLNEDIEKAEKFDKEKVMEELKIISDYLAKTYQEMDINEEQWEEINKNYERHMGNKSNV